MPNLVTLDEEKLRKLASIIYRQEVEAIRNIKFQSEPELAKFLRDSRSCYESVPSLLDAASQLQHKWQTVRNYTLRINYLKKISDHSKTLMKALNELDPENKTDVRNLANDVALYNEAMMEYTKKHQSPASQNYSKWVKDSGFKFPDLVQRYQRELNFDGLFTDLLDRQRLKVYVKIIEASGRGRVAVLDKLSNAFEVVGIAVLVFTTGMIVWDIFTSAHVLQTATREAVVGIASAGGAVLGEVVGVAVSTISAWASPLFVLVAGLVTSICGAFILGQFAGWLIDLIFRSGGTAPLSTDGHRCYVAPMPNGEVLARQIAHQHYSK
ncbi:hypothetical protein QJS10_CPB15g02103 [Acorus calamus]|uniref:Uncharacterized protein n=1 Tax=Acorus calamus TaxID=4465 RepID=A0AAV9D404_ACOCL|nr:hypothetical protein QJS10_CPB15g02103 [Acorus calamus]